MGKRQGDDRRKEYNIIQSKVEARGLRLNLFVKCYSWIETKSR